MRKLLSSIVLGAGLLLCGCGENKVNTSAPSAPPAPLASPAPSAPPKVVENFIRYEAGIVPGCGVETYSAKITAISVADMNGDGKKDIIVAKSNGGIYVYLNNLPAEKADKNYAEKAEK